MALAAAALSPLATRGKPAAVAAPKPLLPPPMRWPAEWEPHSRTLMSMPFSGWIYNWKKKRLEDIQREWAAVGRAIVDFEPVTMVIPFGDRHRMRKLLGHRVDLLEADYNDGWLRDNGPIFISDGSTLTGLDWVFNGWGGAFGQPFTLDDTLPVELLSDLGVARQAVPVVMEGGSLIGDGQGTIITTEECLLNPNRNPGMTKQQIETALLDNFHAQKVIWLPYGLLGDLTSGHVDGVCMYVAPAKVIAQVDPDNAAENSRLQANLAVLGSETDALGRPFEIVKFPILPRARFSDGPRVSHCYINFYPVKGGLIAPLAGIDEPDRKALRRLKGLFPGRKVVGVPTPTATWAGGGVHCFTQQMPKVP